MMELLKQLYLVEGDGELDDPFTEPQVADVTDNDKLLRLERRMNILHQMRRKAYQAFSDAEQALKKNIDFKSSKTGQFTEYVDQLYLNGHYEEDVYLNPTTPAASRYLKSSQREESYKKKLEQVKLEIKKVRKIVNAAISAARAARIPKPQLPASQVPDKITSGKRSFGNPYANAKATDQYAGDPESYAFSSASYGTFQALAQALQANNKPGFTVVYAARINGYINFVVIGGGGKFIWRKYQTAGANGMNWVYIDGNQVQTSVFLRASPTQQRQMLAVV